MRKIIHKLFWIWDFDKEEKWLNEMSAIGLQLVSVSFGRYDFDEGQPGEYIYRMEMLKHFSSHPESERYIRFMEETEAEHVGSLKNWVYFRKKAGNGEFDIYSDVDSRIKHLEKIRNLTGICLSVELICFLYYIFAMIFFHEHLFEVITVVMLVLLLLVILMWRGFMKLQKKIKNLQKDFSLHEK